MKTLLRVFIVALVVLNMQTGYAVAASSEVVFPCFLWGETWYGKYLNVVKAGFEKKYPDIKLRDINIPISSYWDKLYADVTAGTPPDIAVMYDPEIRQYIEADLLEPLDPWLQKTRFKMGDFVSTAVNATNKGKVYGIVNGFAPRALLYNARLLREANLAPPRDLESFYAAVKALRDEKKQQFGFATAARPGNANLMYIEIMPLIAGFGGGFFKDGKPSATSPETIAALTFYKRLYDEDLIPKGMDTNTYRQMFVQGKVAMYAAGPFMAGAYALGNGGDTSNVGTVPLPFPGKKSTSVTVYFGIPKRALHKEEAAKFLMFSLEDEMQKHLVEIVNNLPGRKGMVDAAFLQKQPWFDSFEKSIPFAGSYAPQGAETYASEVIKVVAEHVESMLFKGVEAKRAAEQLQAELEKLAQSKKQ